MTSGKTPGSRIESPIQKGMRNLYGQIACPQQQKFIDNCPINQGNCLDVDIYACTDYWIKRRVDLEEYMIDSERSRFRETSKPIPNWKEEELKPTNR